MLGPDAAFREGQLEAIEAIVGDRARALVVQRTGWGKSIVYWIATRIRRDLGAGPTLIVSPLLALMRNQIAMASALGLRPATINSANRQEWADVHDRLEAGEVDVLLISPERLGNAAFVGQILPAIQGSIGLFVVDEAHCISDWGHDFRPDYRRIGRLLRLFPPAVPILATTATANDRVIADIAEQLGSDVAVIRGRLARDTLRLDAIELADQAERLAWLAEHLPSLPGTGIVYCLTVADTERVARFLATQGIDARPYHAGMPSEDRERLENALIANELKALVATVALGMGFDKPDLGFVVHFQRPGSPIAYYQQVGRAGRAVDRAYGILLSGREDDEISDYFIRTAFPPTAHMHAVLAEVEALGTATLGQLLRALNIPRGQLEQALKLLEIDGALAREDGRYIRTPNPWIEDEERIARVLATRRAEVEQMRRYVTHEGCRMQFLTELLDDPTSERCGRCANDRGVGMPRDVDPVLVQEAVSFLRRDLRPIKPRLRWPEGGRVLLPNEPGIALCVYGDPGWGRQVKQDKYGSGQFAHALVVAATRAIREQWRPDPPPEWVTAVPSTIAETAVGAFAEAVARELGLPYVANCLASSGSGQPQKRMENSTQQAENARSRLALVGDVPPGPVLLIDDIVDSGWTLAVAGDLLRSAGAGLVHPFVLAQANQRDG